MSKKKPITLEVIQTLLPKRYKRVADQKIVDEINHLVEDPDYGEEFKSATLNYMDILSGKEPYSLREYLDAVKFYSLTATAISQAEAYMKVFPERLQARLDRGQGKEEMRSESARFNQTALVNRIRNQALVPLHLVNQSVTQKAINQLTHLMMNARSDVAKVSAATALLKELRPPEATRLEIDVSVNESDALLDLKASLADIAATQLTSMERGQVDLKTLGALKPRNEYSDDVIEGEIDG